MGIKFKGSEVRVLEQSPEALRLLADWHDPQEVEGLQILSTKKESTQ